MKKCHSVRVLAALACSLVLGAGAAEFSATAFRPLNPSMATVDDSGRVMTVTDVGQLEYVSLQERDASNRMSAGWYVGAEIKWPSDTQRLIPRYVMEGRATHTLLDTPEFSSSIKADQFDSSRNAGCGLTRTLKQMDLAGLLWGMDTTTWWAWITPEDVFYADEYITKRIELWNNGNGAYPVGPTVFTIRVPKASITELRDADGVLWYPAVATNSEGKVYGDIKKALSDGGVIYPFGKVVFDEDFTFGNDVTIVLSEEGMKVNDGVVLTADATVIIAGGESVIEAKRENFVNGDGEFKFQSGFFSFRPKEDELVQGSWIEEKGENLFQVVDDGLKAVVVPQAVQNLEYDGDPKTGVPFSDDYTVYGNTAVDAGEYKAIAVPNAGRKWLGMTGDARTNAVEITWVINRGLIDVYVTVTNGLWKYQGDADPKFQWKAEGLVGEDAETFDGDCTRTPGESVGFYPFSFIVTSIAKNFDYFVHLESANFEIKTGKELPASGTVKAPTTAFEKRRAGTIYTWTAVADKGSTFLCWEGDPVLLAADQNPLNETNFKIKWDVAYSNLEPQAVFVRISDDVMTYARFHQDSQRVVVGKPVAGIPLLTDSKSKVTASVSGLPTGLRFDAKTMTITGMTKVALKESKREFKLTISAKNASGYIVKTVQYLSVFAADDERSSFPNEGEITSKPYYSLTINCPAAADGSIMGTVKGTGVYEAGRKTTISAAAKSGYIFEGWYVLGADGQFVPYEFASGDYRKTSQSLTVDGPLSLYAVFGLKTTSDDPISILPSEFKYIPSEAGGGIAAEAGLVDDVWYKGVSLEEDIGWFFRSASMPTVSIAGLPSGVKYDRVTGRLSGVPTKSGLFTVKVSIKNGSNATAKGEFTVEVRDLPTWAYGTFDGTVEGVVDGEGQVVGVIQSATCSNTGKLSGKLLVGGVITPFTAPSFSWFAMDKGQPIFRSTATYSAKENGKTVKKTFPLTFFATGEAFEYGAALGTFERKCVTLEQNPWSSSDKAFVAELPAFAKNLACDVYPMPNPGESMTLKFAAKGKVTVAGKLLGTDGRLKSVSGTTQLMVDWDSAAEVEDFDELHPLYTYKATVAFYAANAKFAGGALCWTIDLDVTYDAWSKTFVNVNYVAPVE